MGRVPGQASGGSHCDSALVHCVTLSGKHKNEIALAGVTQWTDCWPANQRVAGLIPSQDTRLGCGPGTQ